MLPALEWTRPLALWSLALPVLVLLLSFRRERPRPVVLGTFALWPARRAAHEGGWRRRVRPARWLWIASLALAGLALAGPRSAPPAALRRLTVVVDRGATMHLAHTAADGRPTGRGTRLEVALEELDGRAELAGFELRFAARDEPPGAGLRELPRAWLEGSASAPSTLDSARPWGRHDREGVLWLTDRLDALPERAAWLTSGGGPVFGPVSREGSALLFWEGGDELREGLAPDGARLVWVDGQLTAELAALVAAWAEARGHELRVSAPGIEPRRLGLRVHGLVLEPVPGQVALAPERASRGSGWWFDGQLVRAPLVHGEQSLATWLTGPAFEPVVTFGPGRVFVGLARGELGGDPAAFAVDAARLLDRALLPDPSVVPLEERVAAGPPGFGLPAWSAPARGGRAGPLTSGVASLALVLGLLALGLRGADLR